MTPAIADTDFVIDLMDPRRSMHQRAFAKLTELTARGLNVTITAPTRFELMDGAYRYYDPEREIKRIESVTRGFPTMSLSDSAADLAGRLHGTLLREGRRLGIIDAMNAATCLELGEALVTRNVDDFSHVQGLSVETY